MKPTSNHWISLSSRFHDNVILGGLSLKPEESLGLDSWWNPSFECKVASWCCCTSIWLFKLFNIKKRRKASQPRIRSSLVWGSQQSGLLWRRMRGANPTENSLRRLQPVLENFPGHSTLAADPGMWTGRSGIPRPHLKASTIVKSF